MKKMGIRIGVGLVVLLLAGLLFEAYFLGVNRIRYNPMCIVYETSRAGQSGLPARIGPAMERSVRSAIESLGLRISTGNTRLIQAESDSLLLQWSSDSGYWLNICAKSADASDWVILGNTLQQAMARNQWQPGAYFHPRSDEKCKTKREGVIATPVDFAALADAAQCGLVSARESKLIAGSAAQAIE